MSTKPSQISDESMKKATGKEWPEWKKIFEDMGAASLTHKEIASKLGESYDIPGWWAQGLTVRFEQEIGRREPGQNCDGEYQVSVSKTLNGSLDDALAWWQDKVNDKNEHDSVDVVEGPSSASSGRFRYWRAKLADGTRINVSIYKKSATDTKVTMAIQHEKLPDEAAIGRWRAYWKTVVS